MVDHALEKRGALARWRTELNRGDRGQRADNPSTWQYDNLWRAACRDAMAGDFERAGLHSIADGLRAEARSLLGDNPSGQDGLQDVWQSVAVVADAAAGAGRKRTDPFRKLFR